MVTQKAQVVEKNIIKFDRICQKQALLWSQKNIVGGQL